MRINEGLVFPKMTSRDLKQKKRDYLIGGLHTPVENSPQRDLTPQFIAQIGQSSTILTRTEQQRVQRKSLQGEIPAEGRARSRRSSQRAQFQLLARNCKSKATRRYAEAVGRVVSLRDRRPNHGPEISNRGEIQPKKPTHRPAMPYHVYYG